MNSHPQQEDIRALLDEGLNNTVIAQRLDADVRAIARIRREAGLPAAPRSSWTHRPHPQERPIRVLLDEGYTNKAIGERTGADVSTVARIRAEGGFGAATIHNRGKRPHPKDAEIRDLINQGRSTSAIVRELHVDKVAVRRIREEMGVPSPALQPLTLEEKWATFTEPVEGGHLRWTGSRGTCSGTPLLRYREKTYTAGAIAYRQRTGRDPVGQVRAECDMTQCVAPAHVEDEPGRKQLREQLRYLLGKGERPAYCRHGHDQAEHGRYLRDGTAYCEACSSTKRPHNGTQASAA